MCEPVPVRPVVHVVVVDAAQRVLLFRTTGHNEVSWVVPFGDVQPGEEPTAAARRAIETATGQSVSHLSGPIASPRRNLDELPIDLYFLCRAEAFRVQRGDHTLVVRHAEWWSMRQLPPLAEPLPLGALAALASHSAWRS
ncbi:NUDIX domain-containing protein [Friedmanniella luteola]